MTLEDVTLDFVAADKKDRMRSDGPISYGGTGSAEELRAPPRTRDSAAEEI